jgi:hypothetical protein
LQALRNSPLYREVILAPEGSPLTFPVPAGPKRDIPNSLLIGMFGSRESCYSRLLFIYCSGIRVEIRKRYRAALLSAAPKTALRDNACSHCNEITFLGNSLFLPLLVSVLSFGGR